MARGTQDAPPIFRSLRNGSFEATESAAGPWSERQCHGGAPAALLTSMIERLEGLVRMDLARFTIDLIRPVPVGEELRVEICERHRGKKVQIVTAKLVTGEVTLARASALKVRSQPVSLVPASFECPAEENHRPMPGGFSDQFTIVPEAGSFGRAGPASAWFRLNGTLVTGLPNSPLAPSVAAADFGSGIADELDFNAWAFPSLDLTVSFARPAAGSWTMLQSRWLSAEGGRTSCITALSDVHGEFGAATQTVLLEPRAH